MREGHGMAREGTAREGMVREADSAVREGEGEGDGETVSGHVQERRVEGGLTVHARCLMMAWTSVWPQYEGKELW